MGDYAARSHQAMMAALERGRKIHHFVQHYFLCRNVACRCRDGVPKRLSMTDTRICASIIKRCRAARWRPLAAECLLPGNKRPDMVFTDIHNRIIIVEFKTGNRTIMDQDMEDTRVRHMKQACRYAVAWNHSPLTDHYGPCARLFLHYPDSQRKAWIPIKQLLWERFAPWKVKTVTANGNAAANQQFPPAEYFNG